MSPAERRYSATVVVRIDDPLAMKTVTEATVVVEFDAPGDPREMLTKAALEQALENARTAERWSWC